MHGRLELLQNLVPNENMFFDIDGIESIRSVPKKYRTRHPAPKGCNQLLFWKSIIFSINRLKKPH